MAQKRLLTAYVEVFPLRRVESWPSAIKYAARFSAQTLYFKFLGVRRGTKLSIECLRMAYSAIAEVNPELDAVPIDAQVPEPPDIVIATSEHEAVKLRTLYPEVEVYDDNTKSLQQQREATPAEEACIQGPRVAVGGTFDRLHAGHRLLLAATAYAATDSIYIGVTGDALLKNKEHQELLQSFDDRVQAVLKFMHRATSVPIFVSALLDPKKPPRAATDPSIDTLVLSEETLAGGKRLADIRRDNGISEPLHFITVGLIEDPFASNAGSPSADKLSSTALRRRLLSFHLLKDDHSKQR